MSSLLKSLLTRCFFVGLSLEANRRFPLRGMMGENEILLVMSFGSLEAALQMMVPGALKMVWEQPIVVDPTSLEDLQG